MNTSLMKADQQQNRLRKLGLPLLAAAGTIGAMAYARNKVQARMLFAPDRPTGQEVVANDFELPAEDRWFRSFGGVELHGWWIPQPRATATVLYCHGRHGHLGQRLRVLRHLTRLPINLFAFDYRGFGRSEGMPSELGLFRDVRAAFEHLTGALAQTPSRVVLFGHSLGGAIAIDAAQDLPAAGLVVESSFTDVRDMARALFPRLPMHWLARNQFRSIDKVARIRLPKLFIHGGRDELVPYRMGTELFERAVEPKEFLAIERAGHNDVYLRGGSRYLAALEAFFARCVGQG